MRTLTPLILVAVASVCGCALTNAPVAGHYYSTVSFPKVALAEGERIESVEIVTTCARIAAINRIPNDWWVTAEGPVSEVCTLKATAGHGSSSLWSSHDLDGFITIMNCETSCFTIKATMVVFVGEQWRTLSFSQSDLVIEARPNKIASPEPPSLVSISTVVVHGMLDSLPATHSGGGR